MKNIISLKKEIFFTLAILLVGVMGTILFLSQEKLYNFFGRAQISINNLQVVDGDLMSTPDSFDIYIVKIVPSAGSGQGAKKFKRLILNAEIFNSYEHLKWEDVKVVSQSIQNEYIISEFVIEINADGSVADPKVYKVISDSNSDIGERKWLNITSAEFEALGYDWDSIYYINHTEASPDFYPTKDPLTFENLFVEEEKAETTVVSFSSPDCNLEVPTSHSTIQKAIDAAKSGNKICVLAGTYEENIEIKGKDLWLFGAGRDTTIINAVRNSETPDSSNSSPSTAVTLKNVTAATIIEEFTVSNGNYYGMWIEDASPVIQGNIIEDNYAGIRILGISRPTIQYNVFSGNTNGNAIRHNGSVGSYTITHNTFVNNGKSGDSPAILFDSDITSTPVTISNNIFTDGFRAIHSPGPSNFLLKYNLFYKQSKSFMRIEFTNYTNISSLNSLSRASSNISSDPMLDASYKPTTNSPVLGATEDRKSNIGAY